MIDFTYQVAVVTGAGRGLGRRYALELARRGAAVVVNDLGGSMAGRGADVTVADQVVAEITAAGGTAVASYDSVDNPEGGEAIVRTAVDRFGRLDAVISNAGIFNSIPFDELSAEDWRRMLSVHLDGGFYLAQPAPKPSPIPKSLKTMASSRRSGRNWSPRSSCTWRAGTVS